jgi:hypothetical protein
MASSIESGKGYWISVDSSCTLQGSGGDTPVTPSLMVGWNMISSSGSWNETNTGGCNLLSGPWWWDGVQYQSIPLDTPMDDFKGYWVKVSGSCSVTSQSLQEIQGKASLAPTTGNSPVPPGPPATAPGLFTGLLQLLGFQQTIAAPQPSPMPLALHEIRLISAHTGQVELQFKGQGILSSTVRLYTLSGQLAAEAQGTGNSLRFSPLDSAGRPLANGVYLYVVTARGAGGEVVQSELRKLILLR